MSGAQSISTRRAYGVQRVCRVWHCARSSVYARRQAGIVSLIRLDPKNLQSRTIRRQVDATRPGRRLGLV